MRCDFPHCLSSGERTHFLFVPAHAADANKHHDRVLHICLSILNPHPLLTNGPSYENPQKEPIASFITGGFFFLFVFVLLLSGGKMLFCCQRIALFPRLMFAETAPQLNTAANETYQNNARRQLAEMEKVASRVLLLKKKTVV